MAGASRARGRGPARVRSRTLKRVDLIEAPTCALAALGLRHPEPARVQALLARAGFEDRVAIEAGAPGLWADIATPAGVRRLG